MIYIGIDPGLSGAVAKISPEDLTVWRDFDSLKEIADSVLDASRGADGSFLSDTIHFTYERVGARPMQGSVSTFNFGKATGVALGAVNVVSTLRHLTTKPNDLCTEVMPQAWQKWCRNNIPLQEPLIELAQQSIKNASTVEFDSRMYVAALFPNNIDLVKRVKDHNTADAVLLASYSCFKGHEVELHNFVTRNTEYILGTAPQPRLPVFA